MSGGFQEGDYRAVPRSTASVGAVDQGAPGSPADAWWVRLTDGVDTAQITAGGELLVAISAPVSIAGTVTVDQGTSPWVVSGTVSVNEPVTVDGTVSITGPVTIDEPITVEQGTSPWVVSGTVSVNQPVAVTDNGGSLTVDGAVTVSGTVDVTDGGGSLTVDGTVTTIQGTSPWLVEVVAPLPAGANSIGSVNVGNFPAVQPVDDNGGSLTVDGAVTVSGTVNVGNFPASQTVNGTVSATQGTSPWVVSGTVTATVTDVDQGASGVQADGWWVRLTDGTDLALVTAAGQLEVAVTAALPAGANAIGSVTVSNTVAVSDGGGSLTVDGTVAVTQSTSPWVVSGTVAVSNFPATQTVNGTVAVTQSTSPWVTSISTALPAGANNIGSVNVDNFPASQTVNGTVAVTQSTSPWVVSGTATVSGTVTANQGTPNTAANGWFTRLTDGTDNANITAAGRLEVDGSGVTQPVSGTVAVTQSTSPWVVGDGAGSLTVDSPQLPAALVDAKLATTSVDGTTTGNITAAGQSVTLTLPSGTSSTQFQITGVGVTGAVLVFESSVDGTNFNTRVYRGAGVLNRLATSTSDVPSEWRGNSSGMTSVRVRCTALTTGTVTVNIHSSTGSGAVFLNATIPIGGESSGNSSSANIAGAGTFTGTYEDLTNVASISITLNIDRNSTVRTQFSQDGTTLLNETTYSVNAGNPFYIVAAPRANFFRVVVENGTGSVATTRLETIYRAVSLDTFRSPLGTSSFLADTTLAPVTKGVAVGRTPGGSYVNIVATTGASLCVADIETGTLANGAETAVAAAAVQILAANTSRKVAIIQNTGVANIRIGVTGVTATTGFRLVPSAILILEMSWVPTQAIFAIREGAISSIALAQEIT